MINPKNRKRSALAIKKRYVGKNRLHTEAISVMPQSEYPDLPKSNMYSRHANSNIEKSEATLVDYVPPALVEVEPEVPVIEPTVEDTGVVSYITSFFW